MMTIVFLATADAARILGVTPAAVRQMVRRGALLPATITEGGIRLFCRQDVEQLARRRARNRNLKGLEKDER